MGVSKFWLDPGAVEWWTCAILALNAWEVIGKGGRGRVLSLYVGVDLSSLASAASLYGIKAQATAHAL